MKFLDDIPVIAIVDGAYARSCGLDPEFLVRALSEADFRVAVIVRLKSWPPAQQQEFVDSVVDAWAATAKTRWLFNGAAEVTLPTPERSELTCAVGRHWPSWALERPPWNARSDRPTGSSVHTVADVEQAVDLALDWVIASPYRTPHSKPSDSRPILGASGLRRLVRLAGDIPVYALGGVWPADVPTVQDAGARGVAMLGPIHTRSPSKAVDEYLTAFR